MVDGFSLGELSFFCWSDASDPPPDDTVDDDDPRRSFGRRRNTRSCTSKHTLIQYIFSGIGIVCIHTSSINNIL